MNKLFFPVKLGLCISTGLHLFVLILPNHILTLKSMYWAQLSYPILFVISAIISKFIDKAMIKRDVHPDSICRGRDIGPIRQAPSWFNTLRRSFFTIG
jgi:hypothetical protein